jgi:hypothetical protein
MGFDGEGKGRMDVSPEELAHDDLIGMYELEKLKNGFQAPVGYGEPCEQHRALLEPDA